MNLNDEIRNEIKNHALRVSPEECCGLLIAQGSKTVAVKCKNVAINPLDDFRISALAYVRLTNAGHKILGVYHSHLDNEKPSLPDIANSEGESLPHVIYVVSKDDFVTYEPSGRKNNYLGRVYKLGKTDCLTLAIDYYNNELGLNIKDPYPERKDDDFFRDNREKVWAGQKYLEDIIAAGFKLVIKGAAAEGELKLHDCILTSFYNSEHPSHILIYQGNGKVLHQPRNGYSCIEDYSEYFKQKTYGVARYTK